METGEDLKKNRSTGNWGIKSWGAWRMDLFPSVGGGGGEAGGLGRIPEMLGHKKKKGKLPRVKVPLPLGEGTNICRIRVS